MVHQSKEELSKMKLRARALMRVFARMSESQHSECTPQEILDQANIMLSWKRNPWFVMGDIYGVKLIDDHESVNIKENLPTTWSQLGEIIRRQDGPFENYLEKPNELPHS